MDFAGECDKSVKPGLHSTYRYGYALTLLDTLFTREEQNQCLMFKSKKSDKPGLDTAKVEEHLVNLSAL
ncbi:MAG: hypothetical protein MJE68_24385 [Proteobacteria bacterium]|nr:hypothetical protein [Pseudomonadota bacterium]